MCRHCVARQNFRRIKSARSATSLVALSAKHGPVGSLSLDQGQRTSRTWNTRFDVSRLPLGERWALQRFLTFTTSTNALDERRLARRAKGSGGREYRKNFIDQNFDVYSVEYTFADGAKMFLEGRTMSGCAQEFASYAHGTKGSAVISSNSHTPARCRIFQDQNLTSRNPVWKFGPEEPNPYQVEWEDLIGAIRENKPYNEVKRGAEASLVPAWAAWQPTPEE